MSGMTTDTAPLTNFRIIGVRENWYKAAPDAPKQPGGSCWHCGTGIAIEVVIRSTETGETHTIGTTCAERVGLNKAELKAFLADKYAEERYQRSKAGREAAQRAAVEREAREAAEHGPHGTESRYQSGCYCDPCTAAAPHGTPHRFHAKCRCLTCVDWAVHADKDYGEWFIVPDWDVIVDLGDGEIVPAKKVDTRYGYRWCVNNGAAWLPVQPKRRDTLAKKGYTEAEVPMLVERCGRGRDSWLKPICRLGDPIADRWGEPIPRDAGV